MNQCTERTALSIPGENQACIGQRQNRGIEALKVTTSNLGE